ncbi:MAG: hypothetical protein J3K34DRAFT_407403 [Monoraphidium minutum]|nr:MAG: hypothetical protein J3K34DRAFT_407403 [Monoraphidium minutum]
MVFTCPLVALGPPLEPIWSAIYRRASSAEAFPSLDHVKTLYQSFEESVNAHRDLPALGHRPVDKATGEAGQYQWLSYGEVAERVAQIASHLAGLGVAARDRVGVYGANCPEWMIAMQACNRMSYECVPLYDSLGENAVEYVVRHSDMVAVVVAGQKAGKLAKALAELQGAGQCRVKSVTYWGEGPDPAAIKALQGQGIAVAAWEDALAAGAGAPAAPMPPSADDYCTIMYTSGTTGDPKGVLLKHSAVVAAVANVIYYCKAMDYVVGPGDSLMSYLPLAHIFDRVAEELVLHVGGRIGYWRNDPTKLIDDIAALAPTLFIGVPRIFDRIHAGVMAQIAKASPVKRFLFRWAYARKLHFLREGRSQAGAAPVFDRLVFSKVKRRLGGRVNVILSGGAPLAPHVEEFLRVAMCAPVAQGYGLTECCAGASIAIADNWGHFATSGPPLPCIEMRFESVPEMNYDATNPHAPAGEVLLRGPCLFDGYYKAPDKTEEVLDADGWFHTGDIGTLTPEGALKIIDRKKNIFKLSQGEYIAVEKLEATYSKAAPVEQVWVYGDSYQAKLVAVVVPKKHALEEWAEGAGKGGASFEELCADPAAAAWVLSQLAAAAKADRLKGFERVAAVHLDAAPFSVDNDLLTPTYKFKRPALKKHYEAEIAKMYAAVA